MEYILVNESYIGYHSLGWLNQPPHEMWMMYIFVLFHEAAATAHLLVTTYWHYFSYSACTQFSLC